MFQVKDHEQEIIVNYKFTNRELKKYEITKVLVWSSYFKHYVTFDMSAWTYKENFEKTANNLVDVDIAANPIVNDYLTYPYGWAN